MKLARHLYFTDFYSKKVMSNPQLSIHIAKQSLFVIRGGKGLLNCNFLTKTQCDNHNHVTEYRSLLCYLMYNHVIEEFQSHPWEGLLDWIVVLDHFFLVT